MKLYILSAMLCITVIVVVAMVCGIDGMTAAGGISAIVGVGTWRTVIELLKHRGNKEIVRAGLRKAGYSDRFITKVTNKLKSRREE
jgi:hypothetical protein